MAKTQTGRVLAKLATAIDQAGEVQVEKALDSLLQANSIAPPVAGKQSVADVLFPHVNSDYKKQKLYKVIRAIAATVKCEPPDIINGSKSSSPVISFSYKLFVFFAKEKLNCRSVEICGMLGLQSDMAYAHAQRKIKRLDRNHPADAELYELYVKVEKAMGKVK